jgi:FSR family fosmidomycin resistance protein-like MFS transporter
MLPARARRTLALAGVAHALHDGFTDMIYVLLPVWQSQFALSYGSSFRESSVSIGPSSFMQAGPGLRENRQVRSATRPL